MRWVGFLFCCLFGWMAFDSGAATGGYMAILAALLFLPPFVSWLAKDAPAFNHTKRITIGSGMMVLAFILFVFSPSGKIDAEPVETETVAEAPVEKTVTTTTASTNPSSPPPPSIDNDPAVAEAQNAVAGLINLNGHLCAKVENVQPLQMRDQVFEVTCTEYRGGSGTVRYLVDGSTGTASRL